MKIGSGLLNLGNTCFFNAVLQCILHAETLSKALQNKEHSKNCKSNQWCVFCELEKVWTKTKMERVVQPRGLISNLKSLFKKFQLGRQEDSHQFLRYFIQGLQKAEVGIEKDTQKLKNKIEKSNIFEIFGGKMKSSIQCLSCHQKSEIYEHYYDMSLECQRSNSIRQAFDNFFKIDILSGNNKYKCEKCKRQSNANKRFIFNSFPDIFTIQLKRFTNNLRKINKYIAYETSINLTKYAENQNQIIIYDLYGIVVHAGGSSFSGHYFSFIKFKSEWFKMDDSWVSRANENNVMNQHAYLLFYKKRNIILTKPTKIQIQQQVGTINQKKVQSQLKQLTKPSQEMKMQEKKQKIPSFQNQKKSNINNVKQPLNGLINLRVDNGKKIESQQQQEQFKQQSNDEEIPKLRKGQSIQQLFTTPILKSSQSINQKWLARMINVILNPKRYRMPRRLRSLEKLRKYDQIIKKRKLN